MALTITTTLGALASAEPALAPICALRLSARSAYHLAKLARLVATETRHFYETRDGHIKSLGTARDDGGFEVTPDSVAMPAFIEKMTELAAVPVTLEWGPVTVAMLGDEKVSAQDLAALGPLFAEDDEAHHAGL